jgi:phenylacetate-CoA ligase
MTMTLTQRERTLDALGRFFQRDMAADLGRDPAVVQREAERELLELFHSTARGVPAYARFLRSNGVSVDELSSLAEFQALPLTTKQNYHRAFTLAELCKDGALQRCDMLAVSSGSTGEPTVWPRFVADEIGTAGRFEQVLCDGFDLDKKRTLGVVCFALGTWVGGMYTTACLRHLAAKGYPLTVATPGNNPVEIVRILRALASEFEQVVLFGYPPFLKDVIDKAATDGFDWSQHDVRVVTAGEVFSEEWRQLVCARLGANDAARTVASLYGTADGGVLANETPYSIRLRRAIAERPELAQALFGQRRLPTLCQFDPRHRYFEAVDGDLVFSGDGGVPLLRYKILDKGGVIGFEQMQAFVREHGLQLGTESGPVRPLPFVYVFGRTNFALSFYGANVYPENVSVGLEQPAVAHSVTGKFVLEVIRDAAQNPKLRLVVELASGAIESSELTTQLEHSVREHLLRVNSEFGAYVPPERRALQVELRSYADREYFPPGVKHRYTRE